MRLNKVNIVNLIIDIYRDVAAVGRHVHGFHLTEQSVGDFSVAFLPDVERDEYSRFIHMRLVHYHGTRVAHGVEVPGL